MMRFSVAINSFNRASELPDTLESVLEQSLAPAEIIVVDDGSTDDTEGVVRRYSNIKYKRIENRGSGLSRHAAIKLASCHWVATCDSDDLWLPDHLSNLAMCIQKYPHAKYVFSNFTQFGDGDSLYNHFKQAPEGWWDSVSQEAGTSGNQSNISPEKIIPLHTPAYIPLLSYNPVFPSALAVNAEAYASMGGANPAFTRLNGEDSDITRRLSLTGLGVADTRVSVQIRKHAGNKSASLARNLYGRWHVLDTHVRELNLSPTLREAAAAERDTTILRAFRHACWERQPILARQCRALIPGNALSAREHATYLAIVALSAIHRIRRR